VDFIKLEREISNLLLEDQGITSFGNSGRKKKEIQALVLLGEVDIWAKAKNQRKM